MTVQQKKIIVNNNIISVIGVIGVVLAAITFAFDGLNTKIDAMDSKIDSKFDHLNTSLVKNMELINQSLDDQKEINRLEIKSAVKEEFLKACERNS